MRIKSLVKRIIRENFHLNMLWNNAILAVSQKMSKNALNLYLNESNKNGGNVIEAIYTLDDFLEGKNIRLFIRDHVNNYYGHSLVLKNYAKLFEFNNNYMPNIEHGASFRETLDNSNEPARCSTITFGEFRKNIIRNHINSPVFCVGPLMHYAFITTPEKKLQKIKKELGKNLLVFPMHFFEGAYGEYNIDEFIEYINYKKRNFDSVTICVYWFDLLQKEAIQRFKNEDYKIVSAGHRSDPNFLSRLKEIISLSDSIITNDIGTHVGYAVYLNKPVNIVEQEYKFAFCAPGEEQSNDTKYRIAETKKLFLSLDESITHRQKEICNYYWGLDYIRTPDELSKILRINKDIITHTPFGMSSNYGKAIERLIKEYQMGDKEESDMALLLIEAIT